jgi:hypothetical protein
MPIPIKPPLWHQQRELPKLHSLAIDRVAHELSDWLSELPSSTHRFDAAECDVIASRVVAVYLRTIRGED